MPWLLVQEHPELVVLLLPGHRCSFELRLGHALVLLPCNSWVLRSFRGIDVADSPLFEILQGPESLSADREAALLALVQRLLA